jgi:magnesium-transporting ATPase (P-type)
MNAPSSSPWHALPPEEVLAQLQATAAGLADDEAAKRLRVAGPNALPAPKPVSWAVAFARQFASPLVFVLVAVALTSWVLGRAEDVAIIGVVLLCNALIGTVQEGRAERALSALSAYMALESVVLRGGKEQTVDEATLVPGDVVVLREGMRVPADCRLLESAGLRVDESALTGESVPVAKAVAPCTEDAPLAERVSMGWMGTSVTGGSGRAVVVATGTHTEFGHIAAAVTGVDTEAPLRADLRRLSRGILVAVIAACAGVFALGVVRGLSPAEMALTAVSLAVSVIPEGLPVVVTIALAAGTWRMARRHALVRRLQAVEALGQADLVAVDKTGTLTRNELAVERAWTTSGEYEVEGRGYAPDGGFLRREGRVLPASEPSLVALARAAACCASARATWDEGKRRWLLSGDPTEVAMAVLGHKGGFAAEAVDGMWPVVGELSFDAAHKLHALVRREGSGGRLSVSGAPEALLARCVTARQGTRSVPFDDVSSAVDLAVARFASQGLRVIAVAEAASTATGQLAPESLPSLELLGLLAMKDGLRPNVRESVTALRDAGLMVAMLTGDHPVTARAVAAEAGVWRTGDRVLTGADVDGMDDAALQQVLKMTTVFARVTPTHKLRIVRACQAAGLKVGMTGDGVNDAPALRAADLGIAMGIMGTDVARQAADIVLLDDDVATIVAAVEEGRGMVATLRKVCTYLFATNAGEVLVIGACIALGLPLPLLPVQIIWLNLVTDGFLNVGLALEPAGPGLLSARTKGRRLADRTTYWAMLRMGAVMAAVTVWLYAQALGQGEAYARTVALTTLAVLQWYNAWNCRDLDRSLFSLRPFGNRALVLATVAVVALHLLALSHPLLRSALGTVPLSLADWGTILVVSLAVIAVEELRKALARQGPA